MKTHRGSALSLGVAFLGAGLLLTSCGAKTVKNYSTLEDFVGANIGVITGTTFPDYVDQNEILGGKTTKTYYNGYTDCITALKDGKIDAFVADGPNAYFYAAKNPTLKAFPTAIAEDNSAFVFPKGSSYLSMFNAEIEKLQADETE